MGLEYFDPTMRTNDLVQDIKWDLDLRKRFEESEDELLDEYAITDRERELIRARDFRGLYELGLHPYLLSQLARLIYGTGEKAGSSEAATSLIRSLLGDEFESYMAKRGG